MKRLRWILMLVSLFFLTTCGSDDEMDQNTNDPGNTPGQTNNPVTDADEDGIPDDDDQCPDTPTDEQADENGCSPSQLDSDNDGVNDALDECPDTSAGASVNEEGCSDAQSDTSPPVVSSIDITEIAPTFFKVDWRIDEGSKGYIRFGTSSGNYTDSTAIEERYLDRHRQTVGAENPAPLTPNTTYYWQIYVEDEYENSGYWEEQTTTTAEEQQKTYVPDDAFEQFLIDLGFDDVMDDHVITERIMEINTLNIPYGTLNIAPGNPIEDWTGIEDFANLEEIVINDDLQEGFISTLEGMELAPALKSLRLWAVDGVPLIIKNFPQLEVFSYGSIGDYASWAKTIEITDNSKLQTVHINSLDIMEVVWPREAGNIKISNNPVLEKITSWGTRSNLFEVSDNPFLKELGIGIWDGWHPHCDGCSSANTLSLKNNTSLEILILEQLNTSNLNISGSPNIIIFQATGESEYSGINQLDLAQFTMLEELYLKRISSLDITKNKNLKTLEVTINSTIAKLDVSQNEQLINLKIDGHDLNCIKVNQSQLDNIPDTWEVTPAVPYTLDCDE